MQSRKRYEMINFRCESMHAHTHTHTKAHKYARKTLVRFTKDFTTF